MQEDIIAYLREHPNGVPSQVLAELFLKFKNADPTMAHHAVSAILKNDVRCKMNKRNEWFAETNTATTSPLRNEPFTAVYCLIDSSGKSRKLLYISLWNIFGVLIIGDIFHFRPYWFFSCSVYLYVFFPFIVLKTKKI